MKHGLGIWLLLLIRVNLCFIRGPFFCATSLCATSGGGFVGIPFRGFVRVGESKRYVVHHNSNRTKLLAVRGLSRSGYFMRNRALTKIAIPH